MCTSAAERSVMDYYLNGGLTGGSYVESHIFQKGSGIGSVLSSLGRLALPALKKLGGYAANKAANFAGNTLSDVAAGKNVGQALRQNAKTTMENVKYDASRKLQMKRPRKKSRASGRKKRRKNTSATLW